MKIIPYFNFNGNAAEAIAFYEKTFGARNLRTMRYGDMPTQGSAMAALPEEAKNLILQALLDFDGQQVRLSDTLQGEIIAGNRIALAVTLEDEDKVRHLYTALQEGGQEIMSPQPTFFSPCYAQVCDRFGVIWQLITQPE